MSRFMVFCGALLVSGSVAVFAQEGRPDIKVSPYGYGRYEFGQVRGGHVNDSAQTTVMRWRQMASIGLNLKAVINERLAVNLGARGAHYLNYQDQYDGVSVPMLISEAYGLYSFGEVKRSPLELAIGIFDFKYNPYIVSLGEYLFRSGFNPPWVLSSFEYAKARLQGFRVGGTLGSVEDGLLLGEDYLRYDILFTSELIANPLYDYSLGAVVRYSWKNAVGIGCGAIATSIVPLNKDRIKNTVIKPVYDENLQPIDTVIEHYTYQDFKCMGMVLIDPKPLLGLNGGFFTPADLRIYGEFAILGLKNQGIYNTIWERMPAMVGCNVPPHLVSGIIGIIPGDFFQDVSGIIRLFELDLLSVELEYFGTRYRGNFPDKQGIPGPVESYPGAMRDNVYWAVYGNKTIAPGFRLSGLVGRDHLRELGDGGWVYTPERLKSQDHWRYHLRVSYEIPSSL